MEEAGSRGKIRIGLASPVALCTKKADSSLGIDWASQDRKSARDHRNSYLIGSFLDEKFMKSRFGRGKEKSVGFVVNPFFRPKYSYKLVYLVVIGFDILVAYGPIVPHAI
jgi:hypothetical protein